MNIIWLGHSGFRIENADQVLLLDPCHYRTFPILAQSAEDLVNALPGVDVIEPEILQPITL